MSVPIPLRGDFAFGLVAGAGEEDEERKRRRLGGCWLLCDL